MPRPPGTFIVGAIHPARVFRDQTLAFTIISDWHKAARIQKHGPQFVAPPIEEWQWKPSLLDVQRYMDTMATESDDGFADYGPWCIDFENTIAGEPVCMSIWSCHEPTRHRGICIPFLAQDEEGGGEYWRDPGERSAVMEMVFAFLRDPKRGKVGHNVAGHDTGVPPWNKRGLIKRAWNIDVAGLVGDSMALHYVTFAELRHSLAFCASMATDLGPFKIAVHETDETSTEKAPSEWLYIRQRAAKVLRVYNLYDGFAGAMVWNQLAEESA